MKKISTAGVGKSEKVEGQRLTVGLDLGDRSSWECVLNEAGEVVLERKLATTPKAMKEVFGAMPRSRIGLETGMHSPWLSRLLSELGHEVIVAHARNVRSNPDGTWSDTVLHSFPSDSSDGYLPYASPVFDSAGSLYGTTAYGGDPRCSDGCGVVFKLTPNPDGSWKEKVLHKFTGGMHGEHSMARTTFGSVFEITP
jgi:uncharacterized repeat protein (TIGR03803 family)